MAGGLPDPPGLGFPGDRRKIAQLPEHFVGVTPRERAAATPAASAAGWLAGQHRQGGHLHV